MIATLELHPVGWNLTKLEGADTPFVNMQALAGYRFTPH
jgi:hypothetical protein